MLAVQKDKAKNSTFMLEPGEPWPSESTPDPFSTSAGASPTSTGSPTSSSAAAGSASSAHHHSSGLSGGAIAGIAIGAAAVAIIAAALLYLCGRQSVRDRFYHRAPFDARQSYASQSASMAKPQHMSNMTMASQPQSTFGDPYGHPSPALPGYMPPQHQSLSPSMQPTYPASEAFGPAPNSPEMARSPSPSQMTGMTGPTAPAYSAVSA